MRNKAVVSLCIVLMLSIIFIGVSPQVRGTRFILASWSYPDDYGQGIEKIRVYENTTGSWLAVDDFYYYDSSIVEWNASEAIKLRTFSYLNASYLLIDYPAEGQLIQRHNVTVTDSFDTVVFSQQNFTYAGGSSSGVMFYYYYEVVLNFLPEYGEVYTISVTYELFW